MWREQSPRMLRMSATVTSNGSPRMRRQFLVVPHVIACCGTNTVVAIGTGNCVSNDVICADVTSWPFVGDARGSKLLLRTYRHVRLQYNFNTELRIRRNLTKLDTNYVWLNTVKLHHCLITIYFFAFSRNTSSRPGCELRRPRTLLPSMLITWPSLSPGKKP